MVPLGRRATFVAMTYRGIGVKSAIVSEEAQMENPDEAERRRLARQRVLKTGKIVFNNGSSTISCVVRNLTAIGAKLQVETILGVPEKFSVQIMDSKVRPCRVIWKTHSEIGIEFEDPS